MGTTSSTTRMYHLQGLTNTMLPTTACKRDNIDATRATEKTKDT